MSLEDIQARKAIVERLVDRTAAKGRVFSNRTLPIRVEDLPAIYVQMRTVRSQLYIVSGRRQYQREPDVEIECIAAKGADDFADNLADLMAEDVEALLELDPTLGGCISDLSVVGDARVGIDEEGSQPVAAAIVPVRLVYFKDAIECDPAALAHFESLSVVYETTGVMPPIAPTFLPPSGP